MSPLVPLQELVAYLDDYLRIREVPDDANAVNGLEVENQGQVGRIVAAVDATRATFEGLGQGEDATLPPLVLVHHGMFWEGNQPVAGRRYQRLRSLLAQDAALYAAHIPLDVHPEVGNNAVLARALGLTDLHPFGTHKGILIGVRGRTPETIRTRESLRDAVAWHLGIDAAAIKVIAGGPERVEQLGIITGGAGSAIGQAHAAGCDSFLTGEGAAHTYFDATELGVNVLYAGHYATETVGVRALARHLSERFGLPWAFHDHPTGL